MYITVVLIFNDTFNFKKYDFKGTTHGSYVIGEKSNPLLTEYICHIIFFFLLFVFLLLKNENTKFSIRQYKKFQQIYPDINSKL